MAPTGDRSVHFAAIERKHGHPVSYFFDQLQALEATRYEEQMAYLQENHGFSRTHANALVMTHRGSTSTRRHDGPEAWFAALEPARQRTARAIFSAITARFPDLELVIAWNQPMLKAGKAYVFGLSAAKSHFTLNPMSGAVIARMTDDLAGYRVNKNTFVVPDDWEVDASLLEKLVSLRRAELGTG